MISAAAFFCASTTPARKPGPPPVKKETAGKLSAENAGKVEHLCYKAVGAYGNIDMPPALSFLDGIPEIGPAYPPAVELRKKIKSISGGARPGKP